MHKMDVPAFVAGIEASVNPSAREEGVAQKLLEILRASSLESLPQELRSHDSLMRLVELTQLLKDNDISNAVFDITLMRGFDYYTDVVFEVFDTNPDNNRSMFGGGRYDGLVGLFGVEPVPTVGFGMGDVTFTNFLEVHGLLPQLHSETELYVIPIGDVYAKMQSILQSLRSEGVNVAVDTSGRKLEKQIRNAEKKDIANVLFVGDEELQSGQFRLKNIRSGSEQNLSIERLISTVKDTRTKSEL
jgi:histidyl-tRNA synthetase